MSRHLTDMTKEVERYTYRPLPSEITRGQQFSMTALVGLIY